MRKVYDSRLFSRTMIPNHEFKNMNHEIGWAKLRYNDRHITNFWYRGYGCTRDPSFDFTPSCNMVCSEFQTPQQHGSRKSYDSLRPLPKSAADRSYFHGWSSVCRYVASDNNVVLQTSADLKSMTVLPTPMSDGLTRMALFSLITP